MFNNVESEIYELLALNLHIIASDENKQVAFKISMFIKINRPYLEINNYITSK